MRVRSRMSHAPGTWCRCLVPWPTSISHQALSFTFKHGYDSRRLINTGTREVKVGVHAESHTQSLSVTTRDFKALLCYVCLCVGGSMYTCIYVRVEVRGQCWVSSSIAFHLMFRDRVILLSPPPSTEITDICSLI